MCDENAFVARPLGHENVNEYVAAAWVVTETDDVVEEIECVTSFPGSKAKRENGIEAVTAIVNEVAIENVQEYQIVDDEKFGLNGLDCHGDDVHEKYLVAQNEMIEDA